MTDHPFPGTVDPWAVVRIITDVRSCWRGRRPRHGLRGSELAILALPVLAGAFDAKTLRERVSGWLRGARVHRKDGAVEARKVSTVVAGARRGVLGIARGGPSRSRDELVASTVKAVGEARAAGVRASRVLGLRRCAVWCLASVAPAYVR